MSASGAGVLSVPPVSSMVGALALMDELAGLAGAGEGLLRRIEELTDLRTGELQALLAVAGGADRTDAVAVATGQVDGAAAATVRALQRRGLVTDAGTADAPVLRLTEAGRVVRQQAEALQIRVLHGVVSALGEQATGELRSTVQVLGEVLALDGAPTTDPLSGTPRSLT